MVLGLRSKHRKDGSVQVNYLIHVQDLKPWLPTSQSLSLQWVNGDQMTDFLSPNVIGSTVDFNKSFTLPLTLRKDKKDRDKFQKNYLEFHLWEPRKDKPNKDQVLGSAIVNLGDYGIIENVLNLSLPIIWKKSSKSVAQPVLYISIQSNDRDETNSSRSSLSTQSSLDKYGQESASEDDDNDDYTHSSYPNQKDSLNTQPPVVPIKAEPSNNTSSKHTERSMTTVRKQNAASCFSTMGSRKKTIGSKIQMTISPPFNVTHGLQEEIKPGHPPCQLLLPPIPVLIDSLNAQPPVVPIKAEPSNNTSSKHTERSMTTVRKQNAASCFSTMGSRDKTIGSKIQMTISPPFNVTHGLQEETKPIPDAVITSSVSKDPIKVESLHDQVTTFENEQDERTSEDKKISEDNLGDKVLASRKQDKLRSNTLVRKPPGGSGVTANKLKHLNSVQLPKAGGYTGNGFPIASPNRADKDKVIGTNNESSDTAVSRSEISNGKSEDRSRIEMLEEELRETAAIEAGLYSIVAEHGSSTNKVHAPARRLSRFFLHACKEKDQEKRVNAARAIVSGLVLVSKSCGNDVPRLTFWLSNSVMLRAIIYQTLGESSLCDARSNGKHKHSWKKVPDDWRDPQTFIVALEKVEAWMFSRIIEPVWWQTLTPHMQSTATNASDQTVGQSQTSKKTSGSKNGLGNQQGNFSIDLWKKAFKDACERLCPTRAGGHECGCLPVLPRLVMEQLVGRLDVAMFNAILRESAEDMPTDPLSDPIADLRVLPIPAGKSSLGAGAQLKNTIGTWSRWLTDLFGIEDNDANEDTDDFFDDASFKAFRLLHALSDLMMLPFEMLADKSIRKEVCPTLSTPLITRVVCSFVPDEFSPNPIPNSLIEALDAEMQDDDIEAYEGSLINFPCTAPPSAYKPPPSNSFSAIIAGAQSLRRSSSSMLKKSYTSDDELDELDSPLTSILADSSRVSSSSDGIQWFPKGGRSIVRYQLLREVWKDSE